MIVSRWFMCNKHRNGDRIDLWGTPALTKYVSDAMSATTTRMQRSEWKLAYPGAKLGS